MARPSDDWDAVRQRLRDAQELQSAAAEALNRALNAFQQALEQPFDAGGTPSIPLPPPCEHRRLHRPGRPGKIASDPELQAFIRARIDRLTFPQLEDAVAKAFPPARRVRKSAINDWWLKQHRAAKPRSHPE